MKLLFIGDIIGRQGRRILKTTLPSMVEAYEVDLIAVNVENAAGGFGMTLDVYEQLTGLGVDVQTSGNHIWDKRTFIDQIDQCDLLIRPANFSPEAPGQGLLVLETGEGPIAFINLCGRVFMNPADCPFRKADQLIEDLDSDIKMIVIDFHAEATSEKIALGRYLDGKVSAVLGTHTHVTTADEKVLPEGTAYITDVGMSGPSRSVIGMKPSGAISRLLTGMPQRFEVASGPLELNAVIVDIDPQSGRSTRIERVRRTLTP